MKPEDIRKAGYDRGEQLYGVVIEKLPLTERTRAIALYVGGIAAAMSDCLDQDEKDERGEE